MSIISNNSIANNDCNHRIDDDIKEPKINLKSITLPALPRNIHLDKENTLVIFVLGGPGVGKGTQCSKLVNEYDFLHLSAGDLLREERSREDSPYGDLIEHYIREGQIVPYEITINLLANAMQACKDKTRFLIDGFPRTIEQGKAFEKSIVEGKLCLFFECEENEMSRRLLKRSKESNRSDDNLASIKKRFRTYKESTLPVKDYYKKAGKLVSIDCNGDIANVYEKAKIAIEKFIKQ